VSLKEVGDDLPCGVCVVRLAMIALVVVEIRFPPQCNLRFF
jgi:hypothetical protein